MAELRKKKNGVLAVVRLRGMYDSKQFPDRDSALAWANSVEAAILKGSTVPPTDARKRKVREFLLLFAEKVSPTRGFTDTNAGRNEISALRRLLSSSIADESILCSKLAVERWIAQRSAEKNSRTGLPLKESTVRREFDLLSSVFEFARRELDLDDFRNPCKAVEPARRPRVSKPPEMRVRDDDMAGIVEQFQLFRDGRYLKTSQFVMTSGWRRGEVPLLDKKQINTRDAVVDVPLNKTGQEQTRAFTPGMLATLANLAPDDTGKLFGQLPGHITVLFRKMRVRAEVMRLARGYQDGRYANAIQFLLLTSGRFTPADAVLLSVDRMQWDQRVAKLRDKEGERLRWRWLPVEGVKFLQRLPTGADGRFFPFDKKELEAAWTYCRSNARPKKITPHSFRAEFTTRMVESGVPTKAIMKFTGHMDIRSVERYTRTTAQDAAQLFGKAVDAALPAPRRVLPPNGSGDSEEIR